MKLPDYKCVKCGFKYPREVVFPVRIRCYQIVDEKECDGEVVEVI